MLHTYKGKMSRVPKYRNRKAVQIIHEAKIKYMSVSGNVLKKN